MSQLEDSYFRRSPTTSLSQYSNGYKHANAIAISTTSATSHLRQHRFCESQSIDITSININIHDSRGCDLRSTSNKSIFQPQWSKRITLWP
jgi:hypothetical protein